MIYAWDDGPCACGHRMVMCHVVNAARWCGQPDTEALRARIQELEAYQKEAASLLWKFSEPHIVQVDKIENLENQGGSYVPLVVNYPDGTQLVVTMDDVRRARSLADLDGEGTVSEDDEIIFPEPTMVRTMYYPQSHVDALEARIQELEAAQGSGSL